jgi:hypothetical protein
VRAAARPQALLLLLGTAIAGCDNGGESSSPRATVDAYLSAERAGDGHRMCALYSDHYPELVANDPDNQPRLPCAELAGRAARQTRGERNRVLAIDVTGDRAVTRVSCQDSTASDCSLPLVKDGGRWRVDGSLSPND